MNKNKPIKLSFSAVDDYLACSEMYRLKRIEGWSSELYNTPLWFGSAIDAASEIIFKTKMKDSEKSNKTYQQAFIDKITNSKYLKKDIYIPTSTKVKYSKADIQLELLTVEDKRQIKEYAKELGYDIVVEKYVKYFQSQKDHENDETSLYNFIAWHSLKNKGLMLLDLLNDWTQKEIKEVHSIQRKFVIENELGDTFTGLLDLEATLVKDNTKRTLDLKTATNPNTQYPDDCISTSMQLHGYSQDTQKEVGYIILDKSIRKREPRTRMKVILGEVTDEMLDETFDTIDEVLYNIKQGIFEKNTESCFRYGKCMYYDLCHKNITKGLVKRW